MVLEFLHNQKIYNNPQLLKIIIECGNYRKIFEDFGVLHPKRNTKAKSVFSGEAKSKIEVNLKEEVD